MPTMVFDSPECSAHKPRDNGALINATSKPWISYVYLRSQQSSRSFLFFCHPMETIKCVSILTAMQTTFLEQFRQQEGERLIPQAKPRWNNPHWDFVLTLSGFCQTSDRASLKLCCWDSQSDPTSNHLVCEIYEDLLCVGRTESCIKGIDPAEVSPLAQSCV